MSSLNPEDMQDLKQLIEFLRERQVAEFELDRGDLKVRLKFEQAAPQPAALTDMARAQAGAQATAPVVSAAPFTDAVLAEPEDAGLHLVKSPMVGTFYGSSSPGMPPFVSPGDRVETGQEICIIEAMKLMNPIEADAPGEVVKCLVTNGQAIEFGQPLFTIRTN
jgi:acetyl-CoA carboxylase biotin carboxyl carrier protein